MTRLRVVISAILAALVIALGVTWFLNEDDQEPSGSDFPSSASGTYPDGSAASSFRNVGELVATAAFAVEGKVLRVEKGDPVAFADGSGEEVVPRVIVVQVQSVFHRRNPKSNIPTTLRIVDGYWEDGVGYERESVGWATPGQIGFFLVSRDRAPDGRLLATYSPLGGNGVALVDAGQVEYAAEGVWKVLGDSATPSEVRGVLNRGAAAAKSGEAAPVPVTVCYPSVPGDENSEPICTEE